MTTMNTDDNEKKEQAPQVEEQIHIPWWLKVLVGIAPFVLIVGVVLLIAKGCSMLSDKLFGDIGRTSETQREKLPDMPDIRVGDEPMIWQTTCAFHNLEDLRRWVEISARSNNAGAQFLQAEVEAGRAFVLAVGARGVILEVDGWLSPAYLVQVEAFGHVMRGWVHWYAYVQEDE